MKDLKPGERVAILDAYGERADARGFIVRYSWENPVNLIVRLDIDDNEMCVPPERLVHESDYVFRIPKEYKK